MRPYFGYLFSLIAHDLLLLLRTPTKEVNFDVEALINRAMHGCREQSNGQRL
jgi:hypothetical protein